MSYRRFYVGLPYLRIFNANNVETRTILFHEADNQPQRFDYEWLLEEAVPRQQTGDGRRWQWLRGVRLYARVEFQIWAPEFSTLDQSQNQQRLAMTERDFRWLQTSAILGTDKICFFPHQDRGGGWDERYWVFIDRLERGRPTGKMCWCDCVLEVTGVKTVLNVPDEY